MFTSLHCSPPSSSGTDGPTTQTGRVFFFFLFFGDVSACTCLWIHCVCLSACCFWLVVERRVLRLFSFVFCCC
ncbi:hypothetical protein TRSC58_07455 [Trypanosoma rangeli SC58]|uniref:Uncharacterized protein n=1 Tax=Trypanosoma rangeli SC58 TaxID=429131 RepID=A0A061IRL7_TRYRA|nr:hypothetical protein TRSC58_07455 [Trypanosoma rangeli SC58]